MGILRKNTGTRNPEPGVIHGRHTEPWRSVFDLSHQEREDDFTATPYGLMVQMDRSGQLLFVDELDEASEKDILIEWPVSTQCAEKTGYNRFLRLRTSLRYVVVKAPVLSKTA